MNYEKAYKEALERAKQSLTYPDYPGFMRVDVIFPELAESEDERISREITEFLVDFNNGEYERPNKNTIDSWLSWLEKQDKQKLTISDDVLREGISHFGITQYQIDNWLKKYIDVEKQDEQKLSWSKEDEKMWTQVSNEIEAIKSNSSTIFEKNIAQDKIDWLKSLKDRIKGE